MLSFNAWKRFDQLNLVIKSLWGVIAILVLINLMMFIGWKSAPSKLRIYIPPNLSRGAMVSPGHVPRSTVYAFAYQIFTAINTWTDSGTQDYKQNISNYRNYMSVRFYNSLLNDYQTRQNNGALSRTRMMSGVTGMSYSPNDVVNLGNGTWEVDMHLQIVESVGSSMVKNVIMDYPIIVSQVHESIQVNPWGLALSGYYQAPYRIKTII